MDLSAPLRLTRNNAGGLAQIQKAQVIKEKVYRGMKTWVQVGQWNDGYVSQQSEDVGNQKNHKENLFQLRSVREAQ